LNTNQTKGDLPWGGLFIKFSFSVFLFFLNKIPPMVPDDVLSLVLCQLDLEDFCAAANTCRAWHHAARKKSSWPKASSGMCLDLSRVYSRHARPLSHTVWAACSHVVCSPVANMVHLHEWLDTIHHELMHVTTLTLFIPARMLPAIAPVLHSYHKTVFSRITTLRTDCIELVKATTLSGRLNTLIVVQTLTNSYEDWKVLLPTLSTLTHIRLENALYDSASIGKALAQLAHNHEMLRTIHFPSDWAESHRMFVGLFCNKSMNLSSLRVLVFVPHSSPSLMREAITRISHLEVYTTNGCPNTRWLACSNSIIILPPSRSHNNLTSLSLRRSNVDVDMLIKLQLPHLTEFGIHTRFNNNFAPPGPYPQLRLLSTDIAYPLAISSAPNLEQLSIRGFLPDNFAWIHDLSMLARFRHLDLSINESSRVIASVSFARALLSGMARSMVWRCVTCRLMPVSIWINKNISLFDSFPWALIRWRVVKGSRIITFRPRIRLSKWRSWIPRLNSRQVVWERV
jgi:hypothetical protein